MAARLRLIGPVAGGAADGGSPRLPAEPAQVRDINSFQPGKSASARPRVEGTGLRRRHPASREKDSAPRIDPQSASFRLRVGRSRIHGWGVYAAEIIPPFRRVIEYTGERISRRVARQRFLRIWRRGGDREIYLRRLDSHTSIDGARGGSGAERINHSCEPNLVCRKSGDRVFYLSRRRIRAGEELTVDYRFRRDGPRVPCHCGARTCRGTINLR